MVSLTLQTIFACLLFTYTGADPIPQAAGKKPPTANKSGVSHLQRDAGLLHSFAASVKVNAQALSSWVGNDPCNNWLAVYCNQSPGGYRAVSEIELNGLHLGANLDISGTLAKLSDLGVFSARNNDFYGTLPDFASLTYAGVLDLGHNTFTAFPRGQLNVGWYFVDLSYNRIRGQIPSNLGNLRDLEQLILSNNQLSGTVPESICALPKMKLLDITGNIDISKTLGPACTSLAQKGYLKR